MFWVKTRISALVVLLACGFLAFDAKAFAAEPGEVAVTASAVAVDEGGGVETWDRLYGVAVKLLKREFAVRPGLDRMVTPQNNLSVMPELQFRLLPEHDFLGQPMQAPVADHDVVNQLS